MPRTPKKTARTRRPAHLATPQTTGTAEASRKSARATSNNAEATAQSGALPPAELRDARPQLKGPNFHKDLAAVDRLERELSATRDDLQTTIEELQSSNAELNASNEEVVSMNEELQTTNEELEKSREELQSLNDDLQNLMAATGIATVFLDEQLKIKRFTLPNSHLLNLVTTDIGRSFRDFAPRLKDDDLIADAELALKTLVTSEKEVHADDARWYLRRTLPYRSGENRIEGVVITFLDITGRIAAEAEARRFASALNESMDAVTVSDLDGRISAWSDGAEQMFGYPESQARGMNMRQLVPEAAYGQIEALLDRVVRGEACSVEMKRKTQAGDTIDVWLTVTPLKDESGKVVGVVTVERDVTMRRRSEDTIRALNATLEQRVADRTAALEDSEQRVRAVLNAAVDAIITISVDGTIETFNTGAEKMFGFSADEAISRNVSMLMGSPYAERHDNYLRRYLETGERRIIGRTRALKARRKDGSEFPIRLSVGQMDHRRAFVGVIRDTTEQLQLEDEVVRVATLEQRRIGEELHDNTLQELTGLGLLAESLCDQLGAEGAPGALAGKLAAGIAETNKRLRALASGLVPATVTRAGFMLALEELARSTKSTYGIDCRFECPARVTVEDDVMAHHLYGIAQEAVANAVKHAAPRSIEIHLRADDGNLELDVCDDGVGIGQNATKTSGLGLRIMQHRCSILRGSFSIGPGEIGGTLVACTVPSIRAT